MGLTEELCVDDLRTGKRYVVVIQLVDFRPVRTLIGTGVARFTKKEDAPSEMGNIQLLTSAFYRKLEDGDDLDGTQIRQIEQEYLLSGHRWPESSRSVKDALGDCYGILNHPARSGRSLPKAGSASSARV